MKIEKHPIKPDRIRRIGGSFAFIEHAFLRNGYWSTLTHSELLLYFFLILVSDKEGLSYYGYEKICAFLQIRLDQYLSARNSLIEKNLIAFDGTLFQVLSLPS